jgi:hypothetical protein
VDCTVLPMICIVKARKKIMNNYQMPITKQVPKYTVNLKIEFELGFIANLVETGANDQSIWIGLDDHQSYREHIGNYNINHCGIVFDIGVDNHTVYQSNLIGISKHVVEESVEFDGTYKTHYLQLRCQGFCDKHMPLTSEGVSSRAGIKIMDICFDDVSVMSVFNNQSKFKFDQVEIIGSSIFSCNGSSILEFKTPIYRWFLENRQLISY